MHANSTIYVGFGGYISDVKLPEGFEELFEDGKVLTSEGESIDLEDDLGNDGPDVKYFRQIRDGWPCYGFIIGDFGTAETLDPAELHQQAEKWLVCARRIGQRNGIAMEAKTHILSYMA